MIRRALLAVMCASRIAAAQEVVEPEATTPTATAAATTQPDAGVVPELRAGSLRMRVFGSLRPALALIHNDAPISRDRWGYGVTGSRLDLGANAQIGGGVSATFYLRLATERDPMTDENVAQVDLESALVRYAPIRALRFSIGRDQIPLSAQSATPTIGRVFPSRIALDNSFVLPGDVGAQAQVTTSKVSAFAGVWNGVADDAMLSPGASERGLLYTLRLEATPLGAFAFDEAFRPASLRIGVGAAVAYRAATQYTATGAEGGRSRDLRATASLRVAWRGLFVQAEVLRKQITDDLSSRPEVATATYAQASYRFPVRRIDIAPLARAGTEWRRELTAPVRADSVELGVATFPLARGSDRLQVNLMFEHRADPDLSTNSDLVRTTLRLGF